MKETQAWIETTAYYECPYCDKPHSMEASAGIEDFEGECEGCGESFKVKGTGDWK